MQFRLLQSSDAHVVRRVLAGRKDEFETLVVRYLSAVRSVVRSQLRNPADVDDVTQDTFIQAFQKLDSLKSVEKFAPWLLRIARNSAINWQRRQRPEVSLDDVDGAVLGIEAPQFERSERERMLREALFLLEPDTRELLHLHYYAGHSLREIGDMLGISRLAAAKRLQRAREALGAKLLVDMPEAQDSRARRKDAKKLTAIVIAAGASWTAHASRGRLSTWLVRGLKAGIFLCVVVLLLVLAGVAAPMLLGWEPTVAQTPVAVDGPGKTNVFDVGDEGESAVLHGADALQIAAPEKTFPLASLLVTPFDQTIPNAVVVAELVTWGPHELPPSLTRTWTTTSDAHGRFAFAALPVGNYSVAAHTSALAGVRPFYLKENGEILGPKSIVLYPVIRSYGLLIDEEGAPIPDAVIYPVGYELTRNQEWDHVWIAAARVVTDAQGRFKLACIIPGRWKLFVVAPNRVPAYTESLPFYGLRTTVQLREPGAIVGRVVDAQGKPVGGVRGEARSGVAIRNYEDLQPRFRVRHDFVSAGDGTFEIASIVPDEYRFALADAVLALRSAPQARVLPNARATVELVVVEGGMLRGRVLNSQTGAGMPEIALTATSGGTSDVLFRNAITSSSGEFLFMGLPAGAYYVKLGNTCVCKGLDETASTVEVRHGESSTYPDLLVEPELRIAGQVFDARGAPAEAAILIAGDGTHVEQRSNADGTFEIETQRQERLVVRAKGASAESEPFEVISARLPEGGLVLRLSIVASATITGVVLDSEGQPAYGVEIVATEIEGTNTVNTTSDAAGIFGFTGLRRGTYELTGTKAGRHFSAERIELGDGVVRTGAVLGEAPAGEWTIAGTVKLPSGLGSPFCVLTLSTQQAVRTNPLGGFRFDGLAEGTYDIATLAPGYSPGILRGIPAGSENLEITLEPFTTLAGHVLDAATGEAVTQFEVEYRWDEDLPYIAFELVMGKERFNDPQGRFAFERVVAGNLELRVRAPGYRDWSMRHAHEPGIPPEIEALLEPIQQ